MPEIVCFQEPVSGRIRQPVSAGRVEIVTFDHREKVVFHGFWRDSFYLKASFPESEIGRVTFLRKWPGWIFRRP